MISSLEKFTSSYWLYTLRDYLVFLDCQTFIDKVKENLDGPILLSLFIHMCVYGSEYFFCRVLFNQPVYEKRTLYTITLVSWLVSLDSFNVHKCQSTEGRNPGTLKSPGFDHHNDEVSDLLSWLFDGNSSTGVKSHSFAPMSRSKSLMSTTCTGFGNFSYRFLPLH